MNSVLLAGLHTETISSFHCAVGVNDLKGRLLERHVPEVCFSWKWRQYGVFLLPLRRLP